MTLLWQQLIEMAQYEGDDSDNLETTGIARIKHKVSLPISYRLQYLQRAEGLPGQKKKQLHLNTLAYPVSSVIEDKFSAEGHQDDADDEIRDSVPNHAKYHFNKTVAMDYELVVLFNKFRVP
ncbi:hypothetical protein R3P38DRAFT_2792250 [Favolaschia claudopus]|uniref:Uncharacterized protein n=1 Tax=Favolaschia claudopus TaxID=2862362 RepID=A0AAW0AGF2_9AGAR